MNVPNPAPETTSEPPFGRGLIAAGFAVILAFSGGFAAWSAVAPIESAVVAPGIVSVDTNVRTVQHLEGGIVEDILVREGDEVEAGQVLVRLSTTLPLSTVAELQAREFELKALEARLVAERDGLDGIAFDPSLLRKVGDRAAQEAIRDQRQIFDWRRRLLADRLSVLERTGDGLKSEISGLEGQIRSAESQLALVREELAVAEGLMARKLMQRSQVLLLRRQEAELEGAISESRAAIGTAIQKVQETELRMAELQASEANRIVEELATTRARAYENARDLAAARDLLGRTEIRAPISGTVVNMQVHTVGGVIAEGQDILNVVPSNEKLVVRASVDPLDIERVAVGLPATVWLSAINRRDQTAIRAVVKSISADRIVDPRTGAAYYLARVEMDEGDIEESGVPLQSGMSAEVMIRTGARTTWDYLSSPLFRTATRALREE